MHIPIELYVIFQYNPYKYFEILAHKTFVNFKFMVRVHKYYNLEFIYKNAFHVCGAEPSFLSG